MKPLKGKQIADYVWLHKTQRSWHIWAGNPFYISLYRIPLKEMTEEQIIREAQKGNEKAKKYFLKRNPKSEWKTFTVR